MFILYAIPLGILVGLLTGGRLERLARAQFRWAPLALIGLLVQVVLFFGPVAERVGDVGVPIYVGSTALVLIAVLRNVAAVPGLVLVALGALANLAAIVANGGYMPAAPGALAALGREIGSEYSNSAVVERPALEPLTDLFALPAWLPFANVFSVGDVILAVGIGWAIVAILHGRGPLLAGTSHQSTGPRVPSSDGAPASP
jgi:Family of unknown function (DUF5317)